MLRLSTLFLRTLRDDPADAEVPSHRLLVRAGYVRRVAPGIYSWLPLGLAVLGQHRADRPRGDERDRLAGGALPGADPARDLRGRAAAGPTTATCCSGCTTARAPTTCSAPTHEELFTLLVKGEYSSYKDYPLALYQIQTKYRDEARPRAGHPARARIHHEGLVLLRPVRRGAGRVLPRAPRRLRADLHPARLRLPDRVRGVRARWAARRRRSSWRPPPSGEDTFVQCTNCDYAANTEAVEIAAPEPHDPADHPPQQVLDTPDTPTIDTLVDRLNDLDLGRARVHRRRHAEERRAAHARARGRRTGSCSSSACPATARSTSSGSAASSSRPRSQQAEPADLAAVPQLVKGYIGPQCLGRRARSATSSTRSSSRAVPGSPARTRRASTPRTSCAAATSTPTARSARSRSATATAARAAAARCRSPAASSSATSSSSAASTPTSFGLDALGPDGKPVTVTMGSYGVGITRAVAALAEQTYDEKGLCWPRSVAPADVHIVATGKDDAVFAAAERLAAELDAARRAGAVRRPPRCLTGREVQGRRTARRADDRDRRQGPGRRRGRTARPAHRRAQRRRGGRCAGRSPRLSPPMHGRQHPAAS